MRALATGRAMLDKVDDWNTKRESTGHLPIVLGDIGTERRTEFAVVGDTVNVANRLQELTSEHDVRLAVSGHIVAAFFDGQTAQPTSDLGISERPACAGAMIRPTSGYWIEKHRGGTVTPIVAADRLQQLTEDTLRAAGASHAVANSVAAHLVECNMRGVDSHGVNRIPSYLGLIASGFIDAHAEPVLHGQDRGVLRVNGVGGFGIAAMELAVEQLIAAVKGSGIAVAAVTNCGHTGRIGAYADALAGHGMMALILGGGGHKEWPAVTPFGGAKRLLGTNPYAFAMPGGRHGNVVVDFATSATAQGKLAVARAKDEAAPASQIVDRDGNPTSDVEAVYDGGASLSPAATSMP